MVKLGQTRGKEFLLPIATLVLCPPLAKILNSSLPFAPPRVNESIA